MKMLDKMQILDNFENAKLENYLDHLKNNPNMICFDDLKNHVVDGFPIISARHSDGKLYQLYSGNAHGLILAATRSGKTSSGIIPTIMSMAKKKNKTSMVITDPKGELWRYTSQTLRDEGYHTLLINFRDCMHSECWNMLLPIYRKFQEVIQLGKAYEERVIDNQVVYVFENKTFSSKKEMAKEIKRKKSLLMGDVDNIIDVVALNFFPTDNHNDPYWEDSARDMFKAFIYAMLEDSKLPKDNENYMKEETFSFNTIVKIMTMFNDTSDSGEIDGGYFTSRRPTSKAYVLARNCFLENASNTRKCIISMFNSRLALFRESTVRMITTCNTFEIEELISSDNPFAIYISYRDEVKVSYRLIQQFISAIYTSLIEAANKNENLRLENPFYFILDEFGNLPAIPDFDTVISACGGRNIWFLLVLQSYAQLERVYNKACSDIIKDNLMVHIFMGSNNANTKEDFSMECGRTTILSPSSALNGLFDYIEQYSLEPAYLVPVSKLNHIEIGECYITRTNENVLFSKLERYYLCNEFQGKVANASDYKSFEDITSNKYDYVYKLPENKDGKSKFDWNF